MTPTPTTDSPTGNASRQSAGAASREQLLADLPVTERRVELAGIATALLEGGDGPPLVLLHGPGEFAAKWLRVIPELVTRYRVIAPDLPAHGASEVPGEPLDRERVLDWLGQLIGRSCESPPALVGHVLGGAIAARFAIDRGRVLNRLVLVDTLGLARFRPSPRFAFGLVRLQVKPSERAYDRFMRQCSLDFDGLREEMGDRWDPFRDYSLDRARSPGAKAVRNLMSKVGIPRIPEAELERIEVPTSLIWGREDRANRLRIAETASERYEWPLKVIDDCADDPARDRPKEFLRALDVALGRTVTRAGIRRSGDPERESDGNRVRESDHIS